MGVNLKTIVPSALALALWTHPLAAQQLTVERVAPRAIPAGLPTVGVVEGARRWTDRTGQNLVILTRTRLTELDANGNRSQEIHGYHFVRERAGYRLLWQTVDMVGECEVDVVLDYAAGSLTVTDVDHDGIAESTYVYDIGCQGGVDPSGMKLILHEGATKYAIRGTQDYRELAGSYPAPEMHVEAALAQQPVLRDFAVAQWRRFVRYSAWQREGPP